MQISLNFTALNTKTKDKPTMPNVANRVDAFVITYLNSLSLMISRSGLLNGLIVFL